ncbi:MAG: hypothetical protein QXT66_08610 [Nitrososphaerota archaeon]
MRTCLLLSSLLGAFFIWYASSSVPPWLLATLLLGELGFIGTTVAAFLGWRHAYHLGLAMAASAVVSSWMSRAHLSFLVFGRTIESSILLMGNAVQIAYVVAYVRSRRTPR